MLVGLASALAIATAMPRATAGPPCAARYTIKKDESTDKDFVLDNDTHLTWQRDVDAQRTPSDAENYCTTLTLDGSQGFRLPTVFELQTIIDESQADLLIDSMAFPGTPKDTFWSSTDKAGDSACPKCKWYVKFGFVSDQFDLIDAADVNEMHYVRCVR